jgi:hypothetical protein
MPVMVRDERKALVIHHMLFDRGVYMVPSPTPA